MPYFEKIKNRSNNCFHCKATAEQILFPNDELQIDVPQPLRNHNYINIVPTDPIKYSWLKSRIVKVDQNGRAVLTIETFSPVTI